MGAGAALAAGSASAVRTCTSCVFRAFRAFCDAGVVDGGVAALVIGFSL